VSTRVPHAPLSRPWDSVEVCEALEMTRRKPAGSSWQSWIDQQIDEGMRAGHFDNLPGKGKPIEGLSAHRDDDWWLKAKLREERLSYLPPTLRIRKEVEEAREAAAAASSDDVARRILTEVNDKIRAINRLGAEGPPSTLMPLDVDAELERWRSPA
jgi:hypothetical protein